MGMAHVVVRFVHRRHRVSHPIPNLPSKMTPTVHPSQSPARVDIERAQCIRAGQIPAKFHYETPRQAELWLALHEQFAPPADLAPLYEQAAQATASRWPHAKGTLIALGCGGGEKDCQLLKHLPDGTRYVPTDVSEPLARKAASLAARECPGTEIIPLVFDLASADSLNEFIESHLTADRLFTFFGLLPNFAPAEILPKLRALLTQGNMLLLSANLAPSGIEAILPQYDNEPTRQWLAEFPRTNGLPEGEVVVSTEMDGDLEHIIARHVSPSKTAELFVSYRYTPPLLRDTLEPYGIQIEKEFISANGEEGVFLCAVQ